MALGFSTQATGSSGDILPIVKWDAKGGDLIRQDRTQGADGMWVKDESEVALPVKFIMDLERIEVGFLSFASGAPDFRVAKIGEPRPECPPDLGADGKPAFKPCFGFASATRIWASASLATAPRRCCALWTTCTTNMRLRSRLTLVWFLLWRLQALRWLRSTRRRVSCASRCLSGRLLSGLRGPLQWMASRLRLSRHHLRQR